MMENGNGRDGGEGDNSEDGGDENGDENGDDDGNKDGDDKGNENSDEDKDNEGDEDEDEDDFAPTVLALSGENNKQGLLHFHKTSQTWSADSSDLDYRGSLSDFAEDVSVPHFEALVSTFL